MPVGMDGKTHPWCTKPVYDEPLLLLQEGYALDWSRVAEGRLAAGDCASSIRVWDPNEKGGWSVGPPYQVRAPSLLGQHASAH